MIYAVDLINFAIVISGLTISITGLLATFRVHFIDKVVRRFFFSLFMIMIAYALADLVSQISLVCLGKEFAELSKAAVFLESFFSSLMMPFITMYIIHLTKEPYRCRLIYVVTLLCVIYNILLVITQFTTVIYYITEDNVYHRGALYPVLLIPPVLLMCVNIIGVFIRKNKIPETEFKAILMFLLIPIFAMLVQMISYGVLLIVLGSSVSAFLMLGFITKKEYDTHLEQRMLLSEQEFRARNLQMRPHFIYNTLSNIYYLCAIDPKKAQIVVDDFTTYLRGNFNAIAQQKLITFDEELKHTKAYLAVVKARFEELLFVDYDIQNSSFRLPPLSLEPIVENAVKHALDPDSSPLHIWIHTYKDGPDNVIVVENDGIDFPLDEIVDFSSIPDDNQPHIGLKNVQLRLHTLCKGTIDIGTRTGGGTVVTMKIPD